MGRGFKRLTSVLLVLVFVFAFFTSCHKRDVFYTENIHDYRSEQYPIASTFFLPELPNNATVVCFSNYSYWHELFDVYLELKFNTKEEMDEYVLSVVNNDLNAQSKDKLAEPVNGWIIQEQNPYNNSYIDLISTELTSGTIDERWVGYRIDRSNDKNLVSANLSIISYSYQDLTVIQSYMYGIYNIDVNDYVFKYFTRFNISTNEDHKRIIKVKN